MKFDTKTNSNTQNSMVVSILFVLDYKYTFWLPFLGKFVPKNLNGQFELKNDSNMKNSMVMLIFPVFNWKYPFFGNLFHHSKFFVEAVM